MADTYDKDAIKRQVEFYFSDSNFRKDAFLKAQAQANPEGYVEIKVLLTFNKLKALTTDVAAVAESLKDSDVVDVSADGLSFKRSAELPANDDSGARTVYVKGYPVDDETVTIDSVKEQFSAYGKVLLVRLRRIKLTKGFKGSVFVEFDNEKTVGDVVAAAYKDSEVQIGWKDEKFVCVMPYTEWTKRKEAKRKPTKSNEPSSGKRSADGAVKVDETPVKVEFTSGLIFRVSEIPTDATLYEIKDFFKAIAEIKFVDYEGGNDTAHVRCADLAAAARVQEALKNGASLRETTGKLASVLLEGEEEQTYWEKIAANSKSGGGGGRGGGRGGRGGGRGGRGGGRGFKKARRN